MATKAPLVMGSDGLPQVLQSGDQLAAGIATAEVRSLTNGESASAVVIGAPVYISAAGTMKRAQANAKSTGKVVGLGWDASTAAAASGVIAVGGILTATTAQWDAVTGQTGGLTSGSTYFLDPATPGKITPTAPTTAGQVVTKIGIAFSTTDMEIVLGDPILL